MMEDERLTTQVYVMRQGKGWRLKTKDVFGDVSVEGGLNNFKKKVVYDGVKRFNVKKRGECGE